MLTELWPLCSGFLKIPTREPTRLQIREYRWVVLRVSMSPCSDSRVPFWNMKLKLHVQHKFSRLQGKHLNHYSKTNTYGVKLQNNLPQASVFASICKNLESALLPSLTATLSAEFTLNVKDQNIHFQMNIMDNSTIKSVHHCGHNSDKTLYSKRKKKRQGNTHLTMIHKACALVSSPLTAIMWGSSQLLLSFPF